MARIKDSEKEELKTLYTVYTDSTARFMMCGSTTATLQRLLTSGESGTVE